MSPWIDSMKSSQLLQNWAQLASRADTYAIWIKKRNDFIEQRLNDVEEDMIAAWRTKWLKEHSSINKGCPRLLLNGVGSTNSFDEPINDATQHRSILRIFGSEGRRALSDIQLTENRTRPHNGSHTVLLWAVLKDELYFQKNSLTELWFLKFKSIGSEWVCIFKIFQ